MDAVHIHLLLNHVPVLGSIFGVLFLGYALLRGSEELKQVALAILVFAALVAIPVYLTGEPAEEAVEKLAGVSHDIIEQHEDGAKFSLILSLITGTFALLTLALNIFKQGLARWAIALPLVLSVATAVSMAVTANSGGQIRHSEIRAGDAGTQQTNGGSTDKPKKEREDHDD
jgi:uncharacterized membrane protein